MMTLSKISNKNIWKLLANNGNIMNGNINFLTFEKTKKREKLKHFPPLNDIKDRSFKTFGIFPNVCGSIDELIFKQIRFGHNKSGHYS